MMERKSIVLGAIIAVAIVILLAKFLFSERELVPLTQSEKVVLRVGVGRKNFIGVARQPIYTHGASRLG